MANKNKNKASPRKWWERLVSTEIRILFLIEFAVVLIGAIVAGGLIWCSKGFATLSDGFEFARLFIAVMIAVGGAHGLILASRRSAKFSEQVDTGQKQLFNEQLGRGAELLANKEMVVRQTGIRVFEDFAERTPEQIKLIMQIIHDFVRANASSSSKGQKRLDIALGIRTLASLYNKSGRLVELEELVQFLGCHLEGLSFSNANLQGAIFLKANLQGANFFDANLQGANFIDAKLQEANFIYAKLQWADCTLANFSNAKNLKEDQIKGMIFHAENQPTLPKVLELSLDPKRSYEFKKDPDNKSIPRRYFVKSDAEWSGKDVDEWVREYLASIRNPKDDG